MAIDKAGSSPKPPPKPPEPKQEPVKAKTDPKTTTAGGKSPTTTTPPRNEVKPQQTKDGFDSGKPATTATSAQQLGSTTAPTQAGATQDKGALAKLGLTADDLKKAGQAALPHLEKAGQAVVQGHPEQALEHLRNAALASPEVAQKAIQGLAQNLPAGPAKSLLTDPKVAHELVTNNQLHATIGKLIQNPADTSALRELVTNDSARDAALGALSNDPTIKGQLSKMGLEPKDLVDAGKAAPKLLEAFDKFQKQDIKGGLADIQAAVQAAPGLAAKIGEKVLNALPQGVKDQFQKLGITEQQIRTAGPALPHLYEAADAAAKGDFGKAFNSLKEAAISAPDLTQQALKGLAQQMPPEMGAVKSLLTNDAFLKEVVTNRDMHDQVGKLFNPETRMEGLRGLLGNDKARDAALSAIGNDPGVKATLAKVGLEPKDLVEAGKAAPKLLEAFEKFQKQDIKGGLADVQAALQAAPSLASKIGEKVLNALPQGVKDQFQKLGITEQQIRSAGPALPHLYDAADAAAKGDFGKAFNSLKEAAISAPDLTQQAMKGLAQQLPPEMGAVKTLLTNDAFLKEAVTNRSLHDQVGKLFNPETRMEGLRGLLGNDKVRDTALSAIGNDPGVKAALSKVGLEPKDLVDAGKAAPKLLEAFEKFQKQDIKGGLADVQAALQAAPGLAGKIGEKILNALPQGVKDQFQKLGITEQQIRSAGPALPHLYDAADAAAKGDWGKAFNSLKEAAISAPDLTQQAMKGLAQQMPDSLGAVKSLLTNDAFLKEVVTNRSMHDQVGKLFNPDTRMEGVRGLLGNDKVRDAALTAIGNDPGVKTALSKMGLEPKDLVDAGKAAPKLLEAFEKFQKQDIKGGLADVQAALQAAPGLAGKIGEKILNALPQGVKDQFQKLGITEQQIRTAGPALPHLYEAADAAAKGDWGKAFNSLKEAAISAPDLSQQVMKGLAQQMPDSLGAVKSLLTNDAFLKEVVTNRDMHDQVGKLFNPDTRMEGLRGLLGNDKVRDAALTAIGNDPGVKTALSKIGLEPKDLVDAGKAAPKLLEAFEKFSKQDIKGGLADIQAAVQAAPGLAGKIGEKILSVMPQGVKDQMAKLGITEQQLRSAGPALPHLFEAADAAVKGDWGKAFNSLKEAAISAPDLTQQAMKGLAQQLPDSLGAVKSLLTNDSFLKEVVSNRDLHDQVGKLFNDGTRMEGLRGLLGNDKARDAALTAIGNDPGVKEMLTKVGLEPKDLLQAGAAAPHMFDAIKALSEGKIDEGITALGKVGEAAPDLLNKVGEKLVSKLPQGLRDNIAKLGISPSDLLQAGKALPDLLKAGQALGHGDFKAAITSLRDAADKIPPAIIEKAITATAANLSSDGPSGIAKSLLTDKDFVHQLVTNKDMHASFTKMMSGDMGQGIKELLGNEALRNAAGNALAKNTQLMDKLKPFGIQDGKDVAALGGAIFDVMQAGQQIAEGKPGDALKTLGHALGSVPPELRGRMVGALADKLHVPGWAKDTLVAAASLLGNEAVGKALGDAFGALKNGDFGGFVAGIATTGKAIAQTAPDAAKAFINSLANIPGSLGKLFSDKQLNAAMVDSGAATNLFEAAEKLAHGDIGGALKEIAEAGGALLGQGDHFEVAGQKLPFGQQGIENLTRMFGRFVDALPSKLKEKIATESAKFAAKAGLKSVPLLGNIVSGVSAIGSAKDLYDAIKANPKDALNIALAAGQLGLDVAGVVPGLNSITGPLQIVLGTAKVIKGAADLIGDLGEFQKSLVGG